MILAADVGGTKTLLALCEPAPRKPQVVRERIFASAEHGSFEDILDRFLAGGRTRVRACAVGVAGPIVSGRSKLVNLRWPVDAAAIARRLRTDTVRLLNDLEAAAWGLPVLGNRQLVALTPGLRPLPGNAALISAGTGLGMAVLHWDGGRYRPIASEGGHQGFAPHDDLELDLSRYLRERYGRASIERAVSGPALSALYSFLVESGRAKESSRMRAKLAQAADPNAAITEAALAGEDKAASRTLDLFVSLYGAAAGDLALAVKAVGGVFVGGGIAPKILPRLQGGPFIEAFRRKGRLTPLVERIPVRVVREPRTALLGAAACAQDALAEGRSRRRNR